MQRSFLRRLPVVCFALILGLATLAHAADPPANGAARGGDVQAAFDQQFKEFKSTLSQLRVLQNKYQLAPQGDKASIEAEFNTVAKKASELAPNLMASAKAAYLAAPNANQDVAQFLFVNLAEAVRDDRYSEARELGQILVKGKAEIKGLYDLAGITAFASNDFDAAKEYLTKAEKDGAISDTGRRDLGEVDHYQAIWKRELKVRAAEAKANDLPRIKFVTSKGDIVIELFENEAPIATANFITLVESHFYDGIVFHRVLPGFMAQGGDPKGNGTGGPGYTIECECQRADHREHFAGSLSMAHAGKDTGGSQFFLTFVPTPMLNGKHTVFGRVIEGMDVLEKLQRIDPEHPTGIKPDKIIKATVVRKRDHKYDFSKGPAR